MVQEWSLFCHWQLELLALHDHRLSARIPTTTQSDFSSEIDTIEYQILSIFLFVKKRGESLEAQNNLSSAELRPDVLNEDAPIWVSNRQECGDI